MKRGWNLYFWTIGNGLLTVEGYFKPLWFAFKYVSLCSEKRLARPIGERFWKLWFAFKSVSLNHWKQFWSRSSHNYRLLWFAFKFVPLSHWKQQSMALSKKELVVICFQICTFEPLETTLYILCKTYHQLWFAFKFVPLNHWKQLLTGERTLFMVLWFAFKFVPLNHWKQLPKIHCIFVVCCDLLSNLYLWTIGNNH